MKVLVISHNAFSKSNNMGRTLRNQFRDFNEDEIAQLYFVKRMPESESCKDYFCIPDTEVFKSIFTGKSAGFSIDMRKEVILEDKLIQDTQLELAVREKGNHRSIIHIARNLIWAMGKWKTEALDRWLDEINPDVIFFASGDYSFSYKVTLYIAKKRNIPLVVGCYDDFYIGKKKTLNPFYHIVRNNLISIAGKTFDYADSFMSLSEMMTKDYSDMFHKNGYTMYVPTEVDHGAGKTERKQKIFYAGNLGLGRAEQLVLMGRAIKSLGRTDITHIDVYSSEVREELTSLMTEENGIAFHGEVSSDHILRLMNENKYVIHTESFDMDYKTRVMYSVSTKIADCLSCGACIVAFGPAEVASIDYLNRYGAAWIIENEETLTAKLRELFEDNEKSEIVVSNALELSARNHSNKNNNSLKRIMYRLTFRDQSTEKTEEQK